MKEIQIAKYGDVRFKLLTLQQYLKVYTISAKDGYRVDTKNKKDSEKIDLIQEQLAFLPKESKGESIVCMTRN